MGRPSRCLCTKKTLVLVHVATQSLIPPPTATPLRSCAFVLTDEEITLTTNQQIVFQSFPAAFPQNPCSVNPNLVRLINGCLLVQAAGTYNIQTGGLGDFNTAGEVAQGLRIFVDQMQVNSVVFTPVGQNPTRLAQSVVIPTDGVVCVQYVGTPTTIPLEFSISIS